MYEVNVYIDNSDTKDFSSVINSNNSSTTSNTKVLYPFNVEKIHNLWWCINTVGYIELSWKTSNGNQKICNLSGNGKWDLNLALLAFNCPVNADGELIFNPIGFGDLDSFTIILSGKKK